MVQLHVRLTPKAGRKADLEQVYRTRFLPAIAQQDGFLGSLLLRPTPHRTPASEEYELVIFFRTEAERQRWVATDLHEKAWGAVESTLEKFEVQHYQVVAGRQERVVAGVDDTNG